jgi:alkanesulfonate monooxygenase SsuD/methylene tetrahydromethanopterin reductase-like flavin-dependent oxidoreductase (luciferase family)
MYEPVRLLEEIAMLDQLTDGRLDLGLSRGSTGEHVENDPGKAREMFHEELQIILNGLATGDIDFHGKHYQYDHAFTRLKPVQRPYPPLWYPTSNLDSIPWIAANGMNAVFSVHLKPSFDDTAAMVRRYRELYAAHRNDANRLNAHVGEPKYGFSLHVHVAETDALALAQAQPAYDAFIHNYTYRWVRRGGQARYDQRPTFEEERAQGKIAVGSPETVARQLSDYVKRSGANYVIGVFAFGNLPVEQVLSSVSLFASDDMPALSAAHAESDAKVGV